MIGDIMREEKRKVIEGDKREIEREIRERERQKEERGHLVRESDSEKEKFQRD